MDQSESAILLRSRLRPISHCDRGYGHSKMKMPPFSRYGHGGKTGDAELISPQTMMTTLKKRGKKNIEKKHHNRLNYIG